MTAKVIVSSLADEDIAEVQVYFASVGGDIGSRSEQDLIETFVRIAQFPKGFQVRFRHFRYAPLGSFK
jgi:hypothetical protein